MAKNEQRFNFELYDSKHLKNLQKRTNEIVKMFNDAATQGARAGASSGFSDGKKPFYIDDYPAVKRRIDEVINELHDGIVLTIEEGERDEWLLSCEKNDKMVDAVTSSAGLSKAQISQWKQRNLESLAAFQSRKIGGMGLSKRVWNLTDQFRQELELALDLGLGEGKSAAELSRDVRRYLNEPHKLFRRVRDKHGVLRLSKAAKAYHPGRGVYRSSYKNAMRLTRTEINMAYRTADHERWAAIPFVIGTEIVCSNNHPVADICDTLAGVYPKDFKWTGWHPHCRCIALPYLAKGDEIDKYHEMLLNGEDVEGYTFPGTVNDVPQKFKTWLTDNTERIENAKQQPYFIKDNPQYLPKGYQNQYGMKTPYADYAEYKKAMRYNRKHGGFSKEQMANIRELNEALPVWQGQIMPFGLADKGHPNPKFSIENASELGYHHNCQTCTVAFELRRRGFDVTAKSNSVAHIMKVNGVDVSFREIDFWQARTKQNWQQRFLNPDGTTPVPVKSSGIADTVEAKRSFIEANTAVQGRYEVYCRWNKSSAHVFIIERQKGGNLVWYDPQTAKIGVFEERYLSKMIHSDIWVTRIDDKLINPKFAERLLKSEH